MKIKITEMKKKLDRAKELEKLIEGAESLISENPALYTMPFGFSEYIAGCDFASGSTILVQQKNSHVFAEYIKKELNEFIQTAKNKLEKELEELEIEIE